MNWKKNFNGNHELLTPVAPHTQMNWSVGQPWRPVLRLFSQLRLLPQIVVMSKSRQNPLKIFLKPIQLIYLLNFILEVTLLIMKQQFSLDARNANDILVCVRQSNDSVRKNSTVIAVSAIKGLENKIIYCKHVSNHLWKNFKPKMSTNVIVFKLLFKERYCKKKWEGNKYRDKESVYDSQKYINNLL